MDFLTAILSALLRLSRLQTRRGGFFPRIASIRFLPRHRHLAKRAVRAGRSGKPWLYMGKNYRVTAVFIEGKYLIIHGYPLDIVPGGK
jgi:hypothetical protein